MKKIIIVSGIISGLIVSTFMVCSIAYCYASQQFEGNMWVGYASMLLAFSLIFIGVKNFRDKYSNGMVSFGKAFKIGLYITLISSTIYVLVWLIDYYVFIPDFMDKYTNHILQEAKANGDNQAEFSSKVTEMSKYKEMYKNPLIVILFTYLEVIPIGAFVSLISALILKKKVAL